MALIRGIPSSVLPNSGIKGMDIVVANINREIRRIKGATMRGLIIGAGIIHKDTEKTPPLTPVDTGNLRSSYFVVTSKSIVVGKAALTGEGTTGRFKGENAHRMLNDHSSTISEAQQVVNAYGEAGKRNVLMMGYTAHYALFVHENIGMTEQPGWRYGPGPGKKRWFIPRPGAGPKWLEASFKRNRDRVIEAVLNSARVR